MSDFLVFMVKRFLPLSNLLIGSGKMKTGIVFFFLLNIVLTGCLSEDHLKFENIPINGNLDTFANDLVRIGYTASPASEENLIKLKGVFLEKDCDIYLYGTNENRIAYKVVVNLPGESRDSLEYTFAKIQMLYTSRYGIGKSKYKKHRTAERFLFNEPKRIRHLSVGDYTRYDNKTGDITIEVREGFISIIYSDKLNSRF